MAGGGSKPRFSFLSMGHKRSPSSAPSSAPCPAVPGEYVCPISGLLMSDPVILPNGRTFERACIQACVDLGVDPPPPALPLPPSAPALRLSASTPLVPNLALRASILSWCSAASHPVPFPLEPRAAADLVRSLASPPSAHSTSHSFPSSSSSSTDPPSGETAAREEPADSPLEARILGKLRSSAQAEQEEALGLLRRETRDSREQRGVLCTPTLLAALRPFLLSRLPALQSSAAACLVNLSLEPRNKTPIVRSGAVPPLVSAVKAADPATRSNAVAAIFSLAVDDENKAALGALGALPPLLALLSRPGGADDQQTLRDALLALYHLSHGCPTNRSKLAKLESAGTLVRAVEGGGALAHVAMMVMGNLAGCGEGRSALMDAGAAEAVVRALRGLVLPEGGAAGAAAKVEQCVAVMYGLSRTEMRFRGVARALGAEEALERVEAEEAVEDRVRQMAGSALRVLRGEVQASGGAAALDDDWGGGGDSGKLSNSLATLPRWRGTSRPAAHGGVNSTEF